MSGWNNELIVCYSEVDLLTYVKAFHIFDGIQFIPTLFLMLQHTRTVYKQGVETRECF